MAGSIQNRCLSPALARRTRNTQYRLLSRFTCVPIAMSRQGEFCLSFSERAIFAGKLSPSGELLSFIEVADVLGVTSRTDYTLVKRGELRALKVGNSNRIDPPDLRRFIEGAKVPGGVQQTEQ